MDVLDAAAALARIEQRLLRTALAATDAACVDIVFVLRVDIRQLVARCGFVGGCDRVGPVWRSHVSETAAGAGLQRCV